MNKQTETRVAASSRTTTVGGTTTLLSLSSKAPLPEMTPVFMLVRVPVRRYLHINKEDRVVWRSCLST
jgi:hypothetical protein